MRRIGALVLAAALLGACGSGTSPGDTAGGAGATTTDPTTAVTTVDRPPLVDGLTEVMLVAPGEEPVPTSPRFEWDAVAEATSYRLVVLGPDGPIWAWEGTDTSVGLGGLDGDRPEAFGGPVLVDGSSWSVAALAADGGVLAVSEARPLTPA